MPSEQLNMFADWAEENDVDGIEAEDIRGQILAIRRDGNLDKAEKNNRVSHAAVAWLQDRGKFYFHQELHDFGSAMFYDTERRVLENIQSHRFQAWLSRSMDINRADPLFDYVMRQVETTALDPQSSCGIIPECYWASRPGAIYLSNGGGSMYKITAGGVLPCDNGTDSILFAASTVLDPWILTEAVDPFLSCRIFREASFENEHGLPLLRAFAMTLPFNPACKPILATVGPIGSGKTKILVGLAHLYGLTEICLKADEKKAEDFWVAVNWGGLAIVDNVDSTIKWLPDALAAASTNGTSVRRKLFTDSTQVILRARAWTTISSANPTFAGDAGLADRLLALRMVRRTGATEDANLLTEVAAHRDAGLSYIASMLSGALADETAVPCGLNSRHPDFATFAYRVGRAAGLECQTLSALVAVESDKGRHCLENDNVGAALLQLIVGDFEFHGTAVLLQQALGEIDTYLLKKSAKSIGKTLSNLWSHIASVFEATRAQSGGAWVFNIRRKTS